MHRVDVTLATSAKISGWCRAVASSVATSSLCGALVHCSTCIRVSMSS
ncbi:hypothetical protein [Nonomuraea maritima]